MKQYTEIKIKIYLLFLWTLELNITANVILEIFTDKITGPYKGQPQCT